MNRIEKRFVSMVARIAGLTSPHGYSWFRCCLSSYFLLFLRTLLFFFRTETSIFNSLGLDNQLPHIPTLYVNLVCSGTLARHILDACMHARTLTTFRLHPGGTWARSRTRHGGRPGACASLSSAAPGVVSGSSALWKGPVDPPQPL